MKEDEWIDLLHKNLKDKLVNFRIFKKESLLYKLMIDSHGRLQPEYYQIPTRGNLAFQTDIMIKDDKIPLVVLELKVGGFTTHDILTYSNKALKHKEIYPYLRYGLVICESDIIDRKFFIHNVGFNFALALKEQSNIDELIEVIKKQVEYSRKISLTLKKFVRFRKYESSIDLDRID